MIHYMRPVLDLDSTVHNFVSLYLYARAIMLYEPHAGKIYYSIKQVLSVITSDAIISRIAVPK